MSYNIFDRIDRAVIAQAIDDSWGDTPVVIFDGGTTYDGWVHEQYTLTEEGLRFEAWDCGGRESEYNEERPATVEELRNRIRNGDLPLPRWSNRPGLEFVNKIMNEIPEEEILRRIRQVRDALNKCRDIGRIEAAARLFGV